MGSPSPCPQPHLPNLNKCSYVTLRLVGCLYVFITVVKKKNDSLWYCQFHACTIISHKNIIKTLNIKPLMNDLQCNEFYDVVIDAVLTSVI